MRMVRAASSQSDLIPDVTMTIRRCRTDDEKISQKNERELILRTAPNDDVPTLKLIFSLWDSLLYSDAEVTLPICTCDRSVQEGDKPEPMVPPKEGMEPEDVRDRVAIWISNVAIPEKRTHLLAGVNVMPTIDETEEHVTGEKTAGKKKVLLKKFFGRVRRAFRSVLARK